MLSFKFPFVRLWLHCYKFDHSRNRLILPHYWLKDLSFNVFDCGFQLGRYQILVSTLPF